MYKFSSSVVWLTQKLYYEFYEKLLSCSRCLWSVVFWVIDLHFYASFPCVRASSPDHFVDRHCRNSTFTRRYCCRLCPCLWLDLFYLYRGLPTTLMLLSPCVGCGTNSGTPNLCIISVLLLTQSSSTNLPLVTETPLSSSCRRWLTLSNSIGFHDSHSTRKLVRTSGHWSWLFKVKLTPPKFCLRSTQCTVVRVEFQGLSIWATAQLR